MKKTKLKKALEARDMFASELARKARLAERTVQAIVQGVRKPKIEIAKKIANALNVPLKTIF